MYSLQDITTRSDGVIELETFRLIEELDLVHRLELHRFEWVFGMNSSSFELDNDMNQLTVHKDLVDYFKRQKLAFSPVQSTLDKVLPMMEHNEAVTSVHERQRFEDFGSGPWEYVLFPTKEIDNILSLFYRLPDGTTTPLHFDTSTYESLPRFTSMIHPLIVVFHRDLHALRRNRVQPWLVEPLIRPMQRIVLRWPTWTHNRFLPKPTSPKRKRPGAESCCRCQDCTKWEYTCSSSSNSGSERSSSHCSDSSDDSESWRDPEPTVEVIKDDSRVRDWARQTEKPFDDHGSDPVLEQYSLEEAPSLDAVLGRLDEAMGLRKERLKLILDAAKPARSATSSRASKRSRKS
ncbi:hypothetical protein PM082_000310 [Marasmius tenuissimus]|nr:hypothetical protein PM082_000310 [Marasmius tenuissimus]